MVERDSQRHVLADCIVQPTIVLDDLRRNWIGFGAAIEWIAMRGQPLSLQSYWARDDDAAEALVSELADLPPPIAESLVRGVAEDESGPLVPIPSGIWRLTATSDANDEEQPYRLIGTDDFCEQDGSIRGLHVSGYRRIQIRTDFIRDNWPENTDHIVPSPTKRVAQAQLRRLLEKIVAMTPQELAPLTQREMFKLARLRMPSVSRDFVRHFCGQVWPNPPGPRGPRDPERSLRVKELGGELIAAQLPN